MTPPQIALHLAGTLTALGCVAWAWRESVRDDRLHRFPLIAQAVSLGGVLSGLAMLLIAVPVIYAVLVSGLIPRGDPVAFTLMLGWFCVATVSVMIVSIVRHTRRTALGWLTLLGDDRLQAEAAGRSITVTLRPKSVRVYFIANALNHGQYAQFDVHDGDVVVHFWGTIGIRHMDLVTDGVLVRPEGLMVASASGPLCQWLRPYVTTDPPPA